jgi:hypothetical protein
MSQAHLAREISRGLNADFTRDRLWDLEHGSPRNPSPDLVTAVAYALGRPIHDALKALGYELPADPGARLDPELVAVVDQVPLPAQRQLARIIPALIGLGVELRHLPVDVTATGAETEDALAGRAPWVSGKTALKAGSGGRSGSGKAGQ